MYNVALCVARARENEINDRIASKLRTVVIAQFAASIIMHDTIGSASYQELPVPKGFKVPIFKEQVGRGLCVGVEASQFLFVLRRKPVRLLLEEKHGQ
jgi:hypothetical protein